MQYKTKVLSLNMTSNVHAHDISYNIIKCITNCSINVSYFSDKADKREIEIKKQGRDRRVFTIAFRWPCQGVPYLHFQLYHEVLTLF